MAEQSDLHVLPECYIDTKLIKTLVPPRGKYNHQKGTNVLKRMDEKLSNEFALGIVDEDVQDRHYAEAFDVIYNVPGSLRLLKHRHRFHFLIYICPAVEKWIIMAADEVTISLTDYGLPHDFDKLRKLSKTSKSENTDPFSENFQQLFNVLKARKPSCTRVLSYWIKYLKENKYTADLLHIMEETDRISNL
ncbi:hypothetical protein [uncultured Fibrella sp.]|uniref:hypothetical protein n=1 Tax=uncultured Fibrella sp. TaxID=1284596 RepID=UPI0035CA62F0